MVKHDFSDNSDTKIFSLYAYDVKIWEVSDIGLLIENLRNSGSLQMKNSSEEPEFVTELEEIVYQFESLLIEEIL